MKVFVDFNVSIKFFRFFFHPTSSAFSWRKKGQPTRTGVGPNGSRSMPGGGVLICPSRVEAKGYYEETGPGHPHLGISNPLYICHWVSTKNSALFFVVMLSIQLKILKFNPKKISSEQSLEWSIKRKIINLFLKWKKL